jgi:riboflavin synthase
MFSGIVEQLGKVVATQADNQNIHFKIQSNFTNELKVDQSIAHNGVCLTVVEIENDTYTVTAIKETLDKTNLRLLKTKDEINLERCLRLGDRLDGHLVQGHVDTTAVCIAKEEQNGSWKFTFKYDSAPNFITVEKGSICINGVSLTVVDSQSDSFSVCIIPYTYQHTNFKSMDINSTVNLEFDILGKYIAKLLSPQKM